MKTHIFNNFFTDAIYYPNLKIFIAIKNSNLTGFKDNGKYLGKM